MKALIIDPKSRYFGRKLEVVGKHTLKNEHAGWKREMVRVAINELDPSGKWLAFPREMIKIQ